MVRRYVSIWFRHLKTDWHCLRQPHLHSMPFVLSSLVNGKKIITAANAMAMKHGMSTQMVIADARAIIPDLQMQDDQPELWPKLLKRLAEWCIIFTPISSVDLPDGIILDATGCPHLWGGEEGYLEAIVNKLSTRGYDVKAAIADTPGLAWAVARYGMAKHVKAMTITQGRHVEAMLPLPVEALRQEPQVVEQLHKLGLHRVEQLIAIPRASLRRRFGQQLLNQLDLITGRKEPVISPVLSIEPYHERLPCMEPIVTAGGIEVALDQLLRKLCHRLREDQKGLRYAVFKGYRVDGKVEMVEIGTSRPSHHVAHLLKLFGLKISSMQPEMGFELFTLEASKVEDHFPTQSKMWEKSGGLEDDRVSELLDSLIAKFGVQPTRYLQDEHYWPERSIKVALSLQEKPATPWRTERQRPLLLLANPEKIEVTAPIPDYPPMLFQLKGKLHRIVKADGPERIEQEWWLQQGQHRDYYRVEDEHGRRYWLFRLGHYHDKKFQWFIHGYFS
jgi:protein ImuB